MAFNACVALSLTNSQLFLVSSMRVCSGFRSSVTCNLRCHRVKGDAVSIGSRFRNFGVARAKGLKIEDHSLLDDSLDNTDDEQVGDVRPKVPERDFTGTAYVPVYVMLPLSVIDMNCELVDPEDLLNQLRILKSANVDGVMIDCWWGIVEAHAPQVYKWSGYRRLFQMVRDLKLKLQVVMSFHECGGNVGDDVHIPLPQWVTEIGETNPDIYFTDREERRNTECLTWGIDKERVLKRRTAVEVYFDYMRSFRVEFDEFFQDGIISEIEIGLGPCGELRYPSYPAKHGWTYPGIGEFQDVSFQCYDKYLMKSLSKAAEVRGHSFWGRGPENAGSYNSAPHEIGFFRDGGDYDSYYGRFFLNWYSQVLIDHGDRVLDLANLAFEGTGISAKLSGIHWWYKTASHAAELTAGFYNSSNRDGYAPIAAMLRKHGVALNFTCFEMRTVDQYEGFPEALADPEGLVWQVLNAAWDACIPLASENALPCYDREGYNKILENAKPLHNPDGRHLSVFTYLRLSPVLMERHNFQEFERFVKRMHGKSRKRLSHALFFPSLQSKLLKRTVTFEREREYGNRYSKINRTSEEDDDEEMDMDFKEEDDDNRGKHIAAQMMVGMDGGMTSNSSNNQFQHHQQFQEHVSSPGVGARRSKPLEEKERTKLRERHRRAITARILAGLRRHGNYNLRVRADINDVIAALAREAGWVVLPDGTIFPSRSQGSRPAGGPSAAITSSSSHLVSQLTPPGSLGGVSPGHQTSVEYNSCCMKGVFIPNPSPYDLSASTQSQTPGMVGEGREQTESGPRDGGSMNTINDKQIVDIPPIPKLPEQDFAGSPFIPVYVMLPLGAINMKCELVDPDGLLKQLKVLKSANVDGVMVDCWWGIVEAHTPQEYNWNGYKRLFQMVHELKLKLQVVMSFHECGGNVGDDVCIPLPNWVAEIGRSNPDIFFTDREGRRNPECLSWGIDKERVLRGRTAIEVYFDYMRSFRAEFDEFFEDGIISMVEVGLGPCGELRYPSCPVKHGWRYPGIGEFECYDKYFLKSLKKTAEARGHPFWARGPDNAGSYNSQPHETGFFCDGGEYDGYYGRFFLNWYARILVDHGDRVLSLAKLAFEGTRIAAKLLGIHWWYKTSSHAAELTAGLYNPCNHDGYAAIVAMLKKHGAVLNFSCPELWTVDQQVDFAEAHADPEGLVWQVLNAAWDVGIPIAGENALPCYDRVTYNKILDNAKPLSDPDGRHFLSFTYPRLSPLLMERQTYMEFERFVKTMHVRLLQKVLPTVPCEGQTSHSLSHLVAIRAKKLASFSRKGMPLLISRFSRRKGIQME
ncbi:hypothetical protein NC653_032791 [Populus alba x Populus x berolinensis]|uniref:Beta-amylase n=1 Tax=Populus alba x Populus x berolinensis TaxID=444605 RepID=A0AAD6PYD4_9ROSI|nr:hypothetical protein NC653_032791 [Populus alba x Populus x berolinensis]